MGAAYCRAPRYIDAVSWGLVIGDQGPLPFILPFPVLSRIVPASRILFIAPLLFVLMSVATVTTAMHEDQQSAMWMQRLLPSTLPSFLNIHVVLERTTSANTTSSPTLRVGARLHANRSVRSVDFVLLAISGSCMPGDRSICSERTTFTPLGSSAASVSAAYGTACFSFALAFSVSFTESNNLELARRRRCVGVRGVRTSPRMTRTAQI